jgi:transposase
MKDPNNPGPNRPIQKHDETFKRHAVELSLRGDRSVAQLAVELGVSAWSLYQWRKLYGPAVRGTGSVPQTMEEKDAEIRQLRAEVMRMREREIVLKKSLGILSETPESGMPRSKP